jgi:hypothetical protein
MILLIKIPLIFQSYVKKNNGYIKDPFENKEEHF